MNEMRPWLPPGALDRNAIKPVLSCALHEWGEHWFHNSEIGVSELHQDDWSRPSGSVKWRLIPALALVPLPDPVQCTLASAMLGCPVTAATLQPTDRRIVENIATAALDDLLDRLARAAGLTKSAQWSHSTPNSLDACQWWEVSFGTLRRSFKLAVASAALVNMLKGNLAQAEKISLKPIANGLAEQSVELSVEVGSCTISLAEIAELEPGDVLILESESSEPLCIRIDGYPSTFRASLDEVDGRASLTLAA